MKHSLIALTLFVGIVSDVPAQVVSGSNPQCVEECQQGKSKLNSPANKSPTKSECTKACGCINSMNLNKPGQEANPAYVAEKYDFCRRDTWPAIFGKKPDDDPRKALWVLVCRYKEDLVVPVRADYKAAMDAHWAEVERAVEKFKKQKSIREPMMSAASSKSTIMMNDTLIVHVPEYVPPELRHGKPYNIQLGTNNGVKGQTAKCPSQDRTVGVYYKHGEWINASGAAPTSIKQYQ